jgi:hypothetical protein
MVCERCVRALSHTIMDGIIFGSLRRIMMITLLTISDMEKMTKEELENHVLVIQADYERKHKLVAKLRRKYNTALAVLKYEGLDYKLDDEN